MHLKHFFFELYFFKYLVLWEKWLCFFLLFFVLEGYILSSRHYVNACVAEKAEEVYVWQHKYEEVEFADSEAERDYSFWLCWAQM